MLSKRIRSARVAAGLGQRDLADLLGIGRSTVCHWETGRSIPRLNRIALMARVLNVSVADLVGR